MRPRSVATLAAIALSLAFVGCSTFDKVGSGDHVFDEVMSADLSARFPAPAGRPNPGTPPPRSEIYRGTASEIINSAMQNGQEVSESSDGFDLNFQNADITAVSKALLGDLLGVSYSVDPRVQGTISLSSARPVSKADLLPLFESAVKIVGGHVVKEGGIYKIVPAGEALGNGVVERRTNGSAEPGYGITVMPLRYVSAQVVLKALDSFAIKPGMARVDSARNLLLVQGPSTERISGIEAALSLDVDWMKNQSVGIFPVRNASPDTIIAELQNVFDSGREGAAANLVRFQPMNRLNAVLAIAQTPKKIDEVATWVRRLDKADIDNTTVRIYRLRYGNAKVMAGILREVFTGQASTVSTTPGQGDLSQLTPGSTLQRATSPDATSSGTTSMQGRSPATSTGTRSDGITPDPDQPSNRVTAEVATAPLAGASGPALLPNVRITADTANNSLLIYANRDQYKIVERAIFELDRAPMQVAIDATVAEITLKNELQYGVQFYLQSSFKGNKGSIGFGATDVLKRVIPGGNLVLGSDQDPRLVINALRQVTDVNVLSSPALVVLDNQQALLQVGDEVPIATRSEVGIIVPNAPVVNNIEMRNTGVILKVTPRVNANGVVTLDVIQEISNVVKSDAQTLTPTISQRKIQSSIAVASGQTVLLGGLISNRSEKNKSGLPILSELKSIGDLFSQNTGSSERTELIIFIRPQIIRDGIDAQLVAEELRSKLSIIGRAGITRPAAAAAPPPPPVVVPPIRRQ
ncbi:MAG TPA: type II secretion system secretin GspD [Xanthobacteraceae bacterium]|nr:type II secretion system secretin GspD [Xanthobacteraceae bacterium]